MRLYGNLWSHVSIELILDSLQLLEKPSEALLGELEHSIRLLYSVRALQGELEVGVASVIAVNHLLGKIIVRTFYSWVMEGLLWTGSYDYATGILMLTELSMR